MYTLSVLTWNKGNEEESREGESEEEEEGGGGNSDHVSHIMPLCVLTVC